MSNPYDFSSGFLAAKEQKQKQGYYESAVKENNAKTKYYEESTRKLGLDNDLTEGIMKNPKFSKFFSSPTGLKPKDAAPFELPSLSSGYQYGFKPDYSFGGGNSSEKPAVESEPDGATKPVNQVGGYADGTPGGLGLRMPTQQPAAAPATRGLATEPQVAPAPAAANDTNVGGAGAAPATETTSGISMLAERNPKQADTVVRNVFGMSNREFQQLSGSLAMIDFARGKISSDQMLKHVQNLETMQKEGVMAAAQQALAGNSDKAKQLFAEYGDEGDENIDKFEKIRIKNPVPGAAKDTKDEYDALKITYKDGRTMTFDPRRYALELIGTKASMDHDEKIAASIRTTDASNRHTDAINSQTSQRTAEVAAQKLMHEQGVASQRLATSFGGLRDDMLKELANTTGQSDMLTNPDKYRAASAEIQGRLAAGQNLGTLNIMLGGSMTADAQTLVSYAEGMKSPDFFSSKNNSLQRTPDGKQIQGFVVNGNTYARTIDGVLIPYAPKKPQ